MGKPKFSKKKYETPSHPWQENRINAENEIIKKYGLKNKREIWKGETALKKYRGQARELLAKIDSNDPQIKRESEQLITHLTRYNILPLNSTLDDVLALETESILARRLQTLTYLRGLANTPNQARQLISHGHVGINGKRITVPGYMVTKNEENDIGYISDSPINDPMHPARPSSDFKTDVVKKIEEEVKQKEDDKTKPKKEEEKTTKPLTKKSDEKPESDKKITKEEPKKKEEEKEKKVEDKSSTIDDSKTKSKEKEEKIETDKKEDGN
jgi:small subunit ribosomal protein S4